MASLTWVGENAALPLTWPMTTQAVDSSYRRSSTGGDCAGAGVGGWIAKSGTLVAVATTLSVPSALKTSLARVLGCGTNDQVSSLPAFATVRSVPVVASNDVHFMTKDDGIAQLYLECVGKGRTFAEEQPLHHNSFEMYLKTPEEMAALFGGVPGALENTLKINEMCSALKLELGKPMLPQFPLPEGYDTQLEQRGGNLSLGQRQLLSFARALVADAKILVLDEATASIDSYTEQQIQKALAVLLKGRTGLVIAHRLATIRNADRILVLQNGVLIEQGSHDQLMQLGGLYAKLYNMNYASFDDIPEELIPQAAAVGSAT